MARVLVLGGYGMLGHQLAASLSRSHDVAVTIRERPAALPGGYPRVAIIGDVDLREVRHVRSLLEDSHWDVVVNAAGVIKHRLVERGPSDAVAINSLLPRELASLCAGVGTRLIHFSTDCVFSGSKDSVRGPDGYRAEDAADARDLYGLSKLLGEPDVPGCLCIRTSLIGRELRGHHGLVEWYLRERSRQVPGFTRVWFNGLTTPVAARLIDELITRHVALEGLWHVGSEPVSKYTLLSMLHGHFEGCASVTADGGPYCDRRLDTSAFRAVTGWRAPAWSEMIRELAMPSQP